MIIIMSTHLLAVTSAIGGRSPSWAFGGNGDPLSLSSYAPLNHYPGEIWDAWEGDEPRAG